MEVSENIGIELSYLE